MSFEDTVLLKDEEEMCAYIFSCDRKIYFELYCLLQYDSLETYFHHLLDQKVTQANKQSASLLLV
jgi:hypothetical protein